MDLSRPERAAIGCLLGMAVGDALGLPCERLTPRRQRKLFPDLQHHFFFGRGMVSDDTEHAAMTAQAVVVSGGDPDAFVRSLAWRMRWWIIGLPAGVGLATLRGVLRLWLGNSPARSGVRSAGNGPCMRAPILGALFHGDPERLRALVHTSTHITHSHPEARHAALVVALATAEASGRGALIDPERIANLMISALGDEGSALVPLIKQAAASAVAGEDTETFARALGLEHGVSGYVLHTVPVALHAWFRHPESYESAVGAAIRCGGDTDTVAAITGGIVAAGLGAEAIPQSWRDGLCEWPCGVKWLEQLGARSAAVAQSRVPGKALRFSVAGQLLRNLLFVAVVLVHGFRRMLPPY